MKLLMISGDRSLAEGKRGAFYNTIEEFHKYWDRIDIICPRVDLKFKIKNLKLFENVSIHSSPWPLIFQPFWILKKGREIYKNQKFDLITVHEYPPFYNGIGIRLLWNKIKVPYILEIHHIVGHPKAANLKEFIYRMATRFFIKFDSSRAKAVRIVNKNQTKNFLVESGISESKIIYIPSMYIDLEIFKPIDSPKKYDLIFIGRLETNKGIELLLKAIKFSIFNPPAGRTGFQFSIKCLIVGDGPLKDDLKFKIKNLKLENNILLYGRAKDSSEIARLLNESKILVMPSYNEGGPRVVLEAMACGLPVLATNVGLMPDFANKNAVKIIDWDAEDIADKAKELLENKDERKELATAGIEVAKHFERKAMIKNYADWLKEFIKT